MRFDDFDKKMRVYEESLDQVIPPEVYIVARLDGRGFTRLAHEVHQFEAPFDARFKGYMVETTRQLMDCGFDVVYGYTESDEISLLLDFQADTFGRKVRKLNSVLAGTASAAFSLQLGQPAVFDCRVVPLPNFSLVEDYFLWRQEDAHRNSLNSYCYWMLRKQGLTKRQATHELEGKSVAFKNEKLFSLGVNYNDTPLWQRRGIGLYYRKVMIDGFNPISGQTVKAERRRLGVDEALPMGDAYRALLRELMAE